MKKGRPAPAMGALRQVDALARGAFPTASIALLLVLAAVPVGLPGLIPAVALPCVFFWSVFRPAALPPPAVFGLGLLQDLLTGAPVGAGVLTLLVVGGLATRWRPFLALYSF
ncbi:MAG: rod shape-determining protein MreD, partial [Belnapia sp.]|nr:rod shape-determining protein MreD [Belnapia sp.]